VAGSYGHGFHCGSLHCGSLHCGSIYSSGKTHSGSNRSERKAFFHFELPGKSNNNWH
jgi:hypothetical protein